MQLSKLEVIPKWILVIITIATTKYGQSNFARNAEKMHSCAINMCTYSTHRSRVAGDGGAEELPGRGQDRGEDDEGCGGLVEELEGPVVDWDGVDV